MNKSQLIRFYHYMKQDFTSAQEVLPVLTRSIVEEAGCDTFEMFYKLQNNRMAEAKQNGSPLHGITNLCNPKNKIQAKKMHQPLQGSSWHSTSA
jgi:hypothetical protein